ncbi:MAG TPA: hypothetical protein VFN53_06970, partial [Acidobacteriaceae bacterium]|nr:hypothetical protein [Acidobacteriaceae bacterium]
IAKTIQNGWFFAGEFNSFWKRPRGTSAEGLSRESRVFNLQNHDQVGNRAMGERLSSDTSREVYLAASALLLLAPEIPLIFMGQEWAASEPFLFFTDHHDDLGRKVTEGRRKEFEGFKAFDELSAHEVPDPQDKQTFLRSKLDWNARDSSPHQRCLRWYQRLLQIRGSLTRGGEFRACDAIGDPLITLHWHLSQGEIWALIALEGPCEARQAQWSGMAVGFSSEDSPYAQESKPIRFEQETGMVKFARAGAVVLISNALKGDVLSRSAGTPR